MKKAKLFTAFSFVLLSLCIVAVGVYAIYETDKNMGFGGIINIPANLVDVTVYGYIGEVRTTDDYDFCSNQGSVWNFSSVEDALVFETGGYDAEEDVPKLKLSFVIENASDLALSAYFAKDTTGVVPNNYLGDQADPTITVEFTTCTLTGYDQNSDTDKGELAITFSLEKFLEDETKFNFNYTLIIGEQ